MKPRHYPLITICAAAALTLAPLVIFYFVISSGPTGELPEQLTGSTGAPTAIETTPFSQDVPGGLPPQAELTQAPHTPAFEEPSELPQIAATDDAAKQPQATDDASPPPVRDSESTETPSFLSTILGALSAPPAGTTAATTADAKTVTPQTPEVIPAVSSGLDERNDAAPADRDTAAAMAVKAPYEAPRQLAMMSDPPHAPKFGPDINSDAVGMAPPPVDAPSVPEDRATAEDESQGRTRRTTSSRDRSRGSARRGASEQASTPPSSPLPPAPAEGASIAIAYEEVLLQTLREDRPVNRVENVIARASGHGWPVPLVRSDLPDDVWWVQQMAGAQGNAFAARINFGNADTFSGSRFHLVFVFLDTADEVRRFRIAKQFKELPEGIRRSREFTFVRR